MLLIAYTNIASFIASYIASYNLIMTLFRFNKKSQNKIHTHSENLWFNK